MPRDVLAYGRGICVYWSFRHHRLPSRVVRSGAYACVAVF